MLTYVLRLLAPPRGSVTNRGCGKFGGHASLRGHTDGSHIPLNTVWVFHTETRVSVWGSSVKAPL